MSGTVRRIVSTPKAPAPIGPFSQAVLVDKTLYLAGQIGMTTNGDVVEGIEAQTRLTLDNLGHVLNAAGASFSNRTTMVKVTVLLSDMSNFATMNKIYSEYFKANFPARAAYQVAKLPKDALIEIEAIAIVGNITEAKL